MEPNQYPKRSHNQVKVDILEMRADNNLIFIVCIYIYIYIALSKGGCRGNIEI